MWLDKVAKTDIAKRHLFEEYLDSFAYSNVKILSRSQISGEEVYVVEANRCKKDEIVRFYFGDFSVMTDVMNNSSFFIKNAHINTDLQWAIKVRAYLKNEYKKEYSNQFKSYQRNKIKEVREMVNEF